MDIAIIGVDHVGLTAAAVLTDPGHQFLEAGVSHGGSCLDARAAIDAGPRHHGIGRGLLRS